MQLIIAILLYFALGIVVRKLASNKVIWCFVPSNTTCYVVSKSNGMEKAGEGAKSTPARGGDVLKMLHAVPGKKVDMSSSNYTEWHLVPGFQIRGLMYYLYKVEYIGFWNSFRMNKVRESRKVLDTEASKNGNAVYHTVAKEYDTEFVYYTREHSVEVLSAETKAGFPIDAVFTIIYEEDYPLKARLEVADSNAILSTITNQQFGILSGAHETDFYLYGDSKNKEDLLVDMKNRITKLACDALGINIKQVILDSMEVEEATRTLLELQRTTELKGKARVAEAGFNAEVIKTNATAEKKRIILEAEGLNKASLLANEAEEDRVKKVIIPIAQQAGGAAVVFAEAYKENKTVTTSVIGGTLADLLAGGQKPLVT
jgi:regulator of protease activity HflC (stomatin/prohibitin superfamily)